MLPTEFAQPGRYWLQLHTRRQPGAPQAFERQLAAREVLLADADAPHVQTQRQADVEPIANDQLGAAAADVDDQPPARLAGGGLRTTSTR